MTKEEIKNLLYGLHHTTFRNKKQIDESKECGCFYCKSTFKPEAITRWCDNDGRGDPTALCPNCGIDSVIGDACGCNVTLDLLELMNLQFFGPGIDNVNIIVTNGNETEEDNQP